MAIGRQGARSIPFLVLVGFVLFIITHVALVVLTGFRRNMNHIVLALVLSLTVTQNTFAQEVTATISGVVTDPSGATVPRAKITAKSVERGLNYVATSNDARVYRTVQLPVGSYDLTIEKFGFQSALYRAVTLVVNQVAQIDVELRVGQKNLAIEVTGAAPILKTQTTQVDTLINASVNDSLPLAWRNYVQLALVVRKNCVRQNFRLT